MGKKKKASRFYIEYGKSKNVVIVNMIHVNIIKNRGIFVVNLED